MLLEARNTCTDSQLFAAVGLSAYRRQDHLVLDSAWQSCYNSLATVYSASTSSPLQFRVENIFLVSLFLVVNVCKWAIFGELSRHEINSVRVKVGYTVWEFCFGFLIFFYQCFEFDVTLICHELYKFAGLFLCILLLKCFHYLSQERVLTLFDGTQNRGKMSYVAMRFGMGLILLNFIDGMLLYRFFYDISSSHSKSKQISFQDNILLSIFGFEILQMLPLIISTSLKFIVNYVGYKRRLDDNDNWLHKKLKINYVVDFLVNLSRFVMVCIFSIVFLYFYTFPIHIMPSSYATLRMLVSITRNLVNYKKKEMKLLRFTRPEHNHLNDRCVICYDSMNVEQDVREFSVCAHQFHYSCLSIWLDYSSSCPICRKAT